ncbi:signal peptide protein [Rhodopirellula maiorica SM1]|uniref:Signal peptide protein n=1 Tax=Rhodopirellula maiorica SM1 TaxID=1265738 RepID=M5R9N0_9BACT|nr:SxtJ family membrane protein [Rhodopirellula maiorica]EMI16085.1 signal peptide protein [Rhodopirellula maiorica SM1]
MPLLDLNADPSSSLKRWFGISLSALFFVVAFLMRHSATMVAMTLAVVGVLVGVIYYCVPGAPLRVIRAWQYMTYPVTWIISHVLLGTVFFGIVLPTGIVLRLLGYDPLRLKQRDSGSNWLPREEASDISRYFKQF